MCLSYLCTVNMYSHMVYSTHVCKYGRGVWLLPMKPWSGLLFENTVRSQESMGTDENTSAALFTIFTKYPMKYGSRVHCSLLKRWTQCCSIIPSYVGSCKIHSPDWLLTLENTISISVLLCPYSPRILPHTNTCPHVEKSPAVLLFESPTKYGHRVQCPLDNYGLALFQNENRAPGLLLPFSY